MVIATSLLVMAKLLYDSVFKEALFKGLYFQIFLISLSLVLPFNSDAFHTEEKSVWDKAYNSKTKQRFIPV